MFQPGGPTLIELLHEALSSTCRGYDLLAPKFDRTPFRTPAVILETVVRALTPAGCVLDVGCGTGASLAALTPIATDRLVGLDFSSGMLAVARQVRRSAGAVPIALIRADARAMPFGMGFDLVTCFGALGHFVGADADGLVREIARVLRPGGSFVFVTAARPSIGSRRWLFAYACKTTMRVRNALVRPPFVMDYLAFTLPDVLATLHRNGFAPTIIDATFPPPFQRGRLLIARKANTVLQHRS